MTEDRTTITVPAELREQAKELGVNISDVCRTALADQIRYLSEAQAAGQQFESVETVRTDTGGYIEQVRFIGMEVWGDPETGELVYITPKRNVVWVASDEDSLTNFGPIDELWQHSHTVPGAAIQAAEEAYGLLPTVTELDI